MTRTLLGYGGPIFGLSYLLFFLQFYFLKYATDVLLLAPALVGTIFALARLWDGVSDPLIGSWSDRTRSRLGRRRPFLLGALPFLVLGFVMAFAPPATLAGPALAAWVAAALFVFYTAFTLFTIPHSALGAELSREPHERTRLFAARQMSFTLGMLLAFGAIQVAMSATNPRVTTATLALGTALLAVAVLAVTPLVLREPETAAGSGGASLRAGLRDVAAMRPARLLFLVFFVESFGVGAVGTMAPYVAEYLVARPDVVGTLPAAYVIAAIVSIPVWVRVSRRYGKRDTWLAAMLLAALAFLGLFFTGRDDVGWVLGLLVLAGTGMGCGGVLSSSILAEVIDLDAARTGERKEGIFSAVLAFVLKLGIALATALSGVVLSLSGFVPNQAQSAESLLGIRFLFAAMPCAGFLVGAFLFRRFSLEEDADGAATRPVAAASPNGPR